MIIKELKRNGKELKNILSNLKQILLITKIVWEYRISKIKSTFSIGNVIM